jgi:4-hydroxyproline epimerase
MSAQIEASRVRALQVIDSHTAGEPTRLVIAGFPELPAGTALERLKIVREKYDSYRSAIVNEPRGSDVLVGALLLDSPDPACSAAVIFFNNVGYLGMCGHGTIGLVATLAHLGRIKPGEHRIETPVGTVTATLHADGSVSVTNVASYQRAGAVAIDVPGHGRVTGDVAWGGNWFFLIDQDSHRKELELANVAALTDYAARVRAAVNAQGFPEVDHIELFGPAQTPGAHARNFVLCPGNAYDRSPCGTGTSAKVACLAAKGVLAEGQEWIQESIVGSTFVAQYRRKPGHRHEEIFPTITGRAFVTAESLLRFDPADPYQWGIRT